MTTLLGGAYFPVKIDDRYAVNPILPRSSVVREDGTFDPEMIASQCALLAKIAQVTHGPAWLILQKALERVYRVKEEPLLGDLYSELKNGAWEENLKSQTQVLINNLMPYVEGVYSHLLSRPSRIRPFDTQITAFDLAGLKEHKALQSIMVAVIAFSMNRQLADKGVKKVIVIDEAWEFFNDAESSDLVEKLYRQSRKQNAAILALSQSPVEFLQSKAAPAMIGNKFWTMALKMPQYHELLDKFGFPDQAIEQSKSMQMQPRAYSEVMVKFGDHPADIESKSNLDGILDSSIFRRRGFKAGQLR